MKKIFLIFSFIFAASCSLPYGDNTPDLNTPCIRTSQCGSYFCLECQESSTGKCCKFGALGMIKEESDAGE